MSFRDMAPRLARRVSLFSCLCLAVATAAAQQGAAQQVGGQMQALSSDASSADPVTRAMPGEEVPESPGAVRAQQRGSTPPMQAQSSGAAEPSSPASQSSPSEPASPRQTVQPSPTTPQKPVGTAAAETSKVSGVAASQPAGVAIAPAKQRRVRRIVIRVGAILGAGAAVGTVVALTQATPSKPPGAH